MKVKLTVKMRILVACIFFTSASAALAGGSPSIGDRFVILTYWGEDRVAMVDTQGVDGSEEVWSIDTLKTANCSKPYDVKVTSNSAFAYVTCSGGDNIIAIDIVAQLFSHSIKVGNGPRDIAITKDNKFAVTSNSGEDTVSFVSLDEKQVLYTVSIPGQPYGAALIDDDTRLLVTAWAAGELYIVKLTPRSGEVQSHVHVGMLPYTVVAPPPEDYGYVTVSADHSVAVINLKTGALESTIPVGRNPWGAGVSVDGSELIIANNRSNSVSILKRDLAKGEPLALIQNVILGAGGKAGAGVAAKAKNASISKNGLLGCVTDLANNELDLIDLTSGQKLRAIAIGKAPYGIEFVK